MELLLLLTMAYLRLLLLPFSVLYGLVIWLRNRCYDWGWVKSVGFDKPVIVVGNLAVGGTGKSPMTEYLVRLLSRHYQVAILSRGYGRKTNGFLEVALDGTAEQYGDEPLQFKRKFPHVTVAVDENRVHGARLLFRGSHEAIVLDDAYQHRALRPGFAILLFDYRSMSQSKWLLPVGNYRDSFRERRRADIMVVTKMPSTATEAEKCRIRRSLTTTRQIPVLFSSIGYGPLVPLLPDKHSGEATLSSEHTILLVTGIANPAPLYDYLNAQVRDVVQLRYPDHYPYTLATMQTIMTRFGKIGNPSKLIVTTEKDAQRLLMPTFSTRLADLPIYVVPIHAQFDEPDESILQQLVLRYCANTSGGNSV
ncbi:tetraacyldisaccharide 4'-kinase [Parapedobacter koreensis]|uniref:Tetraacyldisaccharide 4'-kinase n=1 Tax=Parapedobacter koreensis TaxID=332977 RepID=A0A1H7QR39_9SPHI|nr:tetraacyldisaccharide 4'-kinase [Parapedobacter koreensis]SEL50085.1 lipid-A-disaccharide kinase [Parapedobacter koreensis]